MTAISIEEVVSALAKNKNVLLYGPPGTGKNMVAL